jgi:acetolactate synthase small subunit
MRTLQVTQVATISRADLVLADDNEYEQLKFQRRRLIPWPDGSEVYLISPEDVVVNKLRWGQQSQSDKQWRDVLSVLKTQQDSLDYEYMHRWHRNLIWPQC